MYIHRRKLGRWPVMFLSVLNFSGLENKTQRRNYPNTFKRKMTEINKYKKEKFKLSVKYCHRLDSSRS